MNNQQEIDENFQWEKEIHNKFFLPFYNEHNWIVMEDNIDSNRKNDWDVKLEVFAGVYKKVDEKALRNEYNTCFVEIIQDIETRSWGWIYGDKE